MTFVSPMETQLRKVIPELCVNDVPERVAEVEMSNREVIVWKYTRIYRMMTMKERELLHKEKELDRYPNPGFPVGGSFRNTN